MLKRLKFTAKSTLIYSIGSIGIKFIGLILLPLYTDKLTTDQYGMWSLLEVTGQLFLMIVGIRMSTAMLRFYASEKEKKTRSKIVFTAFFTTFFCIALFNLVAQPFTEKFSELFFDTPEFKRYFFLMILWISTETFNLLALDLLRVKEKPALYTIVTLVKFTAVLLFIIYFIAVRGLGIEGIILGQLLGSGLLLLMTTPFVIREMRWELDKKLLFEMVKYGLPLVISGIATYVLTVGDRYLIKYFLDYHDVGVYSLSYKISNFIKIVFVQAFQLGFLPIAFNLFNQPGSKRFFSKIFTYYAFIIFWGGMALSIFAKEIVYTFSSSADYYDAAVFIPYLTLAIAFFGIQSFFLIGIHYSKKTHFIAIITSIVLVVNIALNILLIPRLGLYGAAITYIFSGVIMSVIYYYQSQKYYTVNYELKKVFIILFLAIGLFVVSTFFNESALLIRLLVKVSIIVLFPFILYLLNFYEPVEIERIIMIWRRWRNPKNWYKNLKDIFSSEAIDM